jgi:hypothetical protein
VVNDSDDASWLAKAPQPTPDIVRERGVARAKEARRENVGSGLVYVGAYGVVFGASGILSTSTIYLLNVPGDDSFMTLSQWRILQAADAASWGVALVGSGLLVAGVRKMNH